MTNFIEEFYYGNIDPQARSFEQNKKVQRDMQMLNVRCTSIQECISLRTVG